MEGFVYGIKFGTPRMRAIIDKLEVAEPVGRKQTERWVSKRERLGLKEDRTAPLLQEEATLRTAYSLEASRGSQCAL